MAARLLVLTFWLAGMVAAGPCFADGPADNNRNTVRRVPKLGIVVPAERASQLREKLATLQQKIAELRQPQGTASPDLIPDVMIFERAVRCALDYQEFFAEVELQRADTLLDEGVARADELKSPNPLLTGREPLTGRTVCTPASDGLLIVP